MKLFAHLLRKLGGLLGPRRDAHSAIVRMCDDLRIPPETRAIFVETLPAVALVLRQGATKDEGEGRWEKISSRKHAEAMLRHWNRHDPRVENLDYDSLQPHWAHAIARMLMSVAKFNRFE